MKIAVQGSKNFSDYTIFLRAMRTALYAMKPEDKVIELYPLGNHVLNNMAIGFANITEDDLRPRGIKISCHKRPASWGEQHVKEFDYIAYFCKPGEPFSRLIEIADELELNPGVYSYE